MRKLISTNRYCSNIKLAYIGNENHSDYDHKFAKKYQKRKYSKGDSQSDMEYKVTDRTIEADKKKVLAGQIPLSVLKNLSKDMILVE